MGYRSHVAFAITTEAEVRERLINPIVAKILDEADSVKTRDKHNIYEWTSTKWDDTFSEIRTFETWLNQMEDEDPIPFQFLRHGEDTEDVEERGNWEMGMRFGIIID